MPELADDQVPKTAWHLGGRGEDAVLSQYEQRMIFDHYVIPEDTTLTVHENGQFRVTA